MAGPDFEGMTVEDNTMWLKEQGIPSEYCDAFSGVFDSYFSSVVHVAICDSRISFQITTLMERSFVN